MANARSAELLHNPTSGPEFPDGFTITIKNVDDLKSDLDLTRLGVEGHNLVVRSQDLILDFLWEKMFLAEAHY